MVFVVSSGFISCADDEEETVIDETFTIHASTYQYTSFSLNRTATVSVNVNVTSGSGVSVYLFNDTQFGIYKMESVSKFQYYTALSSDTPVTTLKKSASLNSGNWHIVVQNASDSSQIASVKITAE